MDVLSWETAPELLDAKQAGQLLSLKPVWVRRHFKDIAVRAGMRMLRFPKENLKQWAETQGAAMRN